MRFTFRHWIVILSILPLILGCISHKETNAPNDLTITPEADSQKDFKFFTSDDFVKVLVENGGTFNKEEYFDKRYVDKYGNSYELTSVYNGDCYISCNITNIPDMKLLLPLKNYIKSLGIFENSPITDIAFLENFHRLESLYIGNTNILNFKPLGKLVSLDWLRIDNEYPVTIDCSIFANLANLKALMLSTDRITNLEAIFDKSQEEFKLLRFEFIKFGEYTFNKKRPGSFMFKVEGLTPENKNSREKYGNKYGENYVDQYGNKFYNASQSGEDISVGIRSTPDMDVLLRLKNDITNLYVYENSPITDISFLRDFPKLKKLRLTNPNILTLKSIDSLSNLGSLSIDLTIGKKFLMENSYTGILDFLLSFTNRDKLDVLFLIDEDIKDKEEMYLLAQEVFKISGIERIEIDGYSIQKNYKKSFVFEKGKYHILQYNANVRTEPNKNSKAIAVLNTHDEIEILENTFVEEKINDVWGFWYKIKYGGVSGYTFGGNIAYKALVTDIDKNGVKDFFYFRFSDSTDYIEPNKDVIIYINGRRINTNVLSESKRYFDEQSFRWCEFEEDEGCVLIGLTQYGRHQYEYLHIFKVTPDGKIEFITNWNEIDYW